jgi:hypothetical protein
MRGISEAALWPPTEINILECGWVGWMVREEEEEEEEEEVGGLLKSSPPSLSPLHSTIIAAADAYSTASALVRTLLKD